MVCDPVKRPVVVVVAAVDPVTTDSLHVGLVPTRRRALTDIVLPELGEPRVVDVAVFLDDSAPWLPPRVTVSASVFGRSPKETGTPSNV